MCSRVVHAAVTSQMRKYQVSIIVAHRENKCKTGQEKSNNCLGNAALFPSFSLIFSLNYACNCFNSLVHFVKGFRTGLPKVCHFDIVNYFELKVIKTL